MASFFLDTYAMIEYLRGNRNYLKYFSDSELVTGILNLIELYFLVLREHCEEKADEAYAALQHYHEDLVEEDIKTGMKLRLRARLGKINLSYVDAIGYTMAERFRAKYLTGDDAFKTFPNVEFVK